MSSTPHSSASHQSSAVLEEVTSTIGIRIPLHPHPFDEISPIAISQGEFRENNDALSRAELSRPSAAVMLAAHCITTPALRCPARPWLPGSWWKRQLLFLLV